MLNLNELLQSSDQVDFDQDLLSALSKLDPSHLPLKQLTQYSGLFDQDSLQFSILHKNETDKHLLVKLGLFYQEVSNACPCAGDEPEHIDGHCEMLLRIDKQLGTTDFSLL